MQQRLPRHQSSNALLSPPESPRDTTIGTSQNEKGAGVDTEDESEDNESAFNDGIVDAATSSDNMIFQCLKCLMPKYPWCLLSPSFAKSTNGTPPNGTTLSFHSSVALDA